MNKTPAPFSGILVLDKPSGFTSHDAVGKLRRLLNTRQIGHTGTLDPLATGVLPMLCGRAVKASKNAARAAKNRFMAVLQKTIIHYNYIQSTTKRRKLQHHRRHHPPVILQLYYKEPGGVETGGKSGINEL